MREFEDTIFLGNGLISLAECYKLHKRLDYGIQLLGGLQQPDRPRNEVEHRNCLDSRYSIKFELEEVIKDIVAALGGIK